MSILTPGHLSFPHCLVLTLLSMVIYPCMCEFFGELSILSHWLSACFYARIILFDYCSFVKCFKVRKCEDSIIVLHSQDSFAYWGSLWYHMFFRVFLISRQRHWDFDRCCIESVDCFLWPKCWAYCFGVPGSQVVPDTCAWAQEIPNKWMLLSGQWLLCEENQRRGGYVFSSLDSRAVFPGW